MSRWLAVPLLLLAGGCSLGEGSTGRSPAPPPAAPPPSATAEGVPAGVLTDPAADPVLSAPWMAEPAVLELVETWAARWRRDGSAFERVLERMEEHRGTVQERLRARGLPAALVYLPLAESRYDPEAVSRSGAAGLWQLMAPTARGLGLRVDRRGDDRFDPVRSTDAALTYLEWLVERYESWPLALVAYNAGPGRLDRLLETHVSPGARGDVAYVRLLPHLHDQARHFVPRFVGALLAAEGWDGIWWIPEAAGLAGSR